MLQGLRGKMPLIVGLSGLTVGLSTLGFMLEQRKRADATSTALERLIASADVVLFSTTTCPHCRVAKQLLDKAGIPAEEVLLDVPRLRPNVDMAEVRRELMEKTRWRTVPQVFIKGTFIGGASDLQQLWDTGKLAALQKRQ